MPSHRQHSQLPMARQPGLFTGGLRDLRCLDYLQGMSEITNNPQHISLHCPKRNLIDPQEQLKAQKQHADSTKITIVLFYRQSKGRYIHQQSRKDSVKNQSRSKKRKSKARKVRGKTYKYLRNCNFKVEPVLETREPLHLQCCSYKDTSKLH